MRKKAPLSAADFCLKIAGYSNAFAKLEKSMTRTSRAIDALRRPDASLSRVPNTVRQSIAEVIEDQQTALERAYGILWRMPDAATGHARKLLSEAIGDEGQKCGIAYAVETFGPATEAEFLTENDIAALCGGKNAKRRAR